MPSDERLIGCLQGEYASGEQTIVSVYKAGRAFRLVGPGSPHVCDPSILTIEEIKREAFRVYGIWHFVFEAAEEH